MKSIYVMTAASLAFAMPCTAQNLNVSAVAGPGGDTQVTADIWVDNWFALYVDGQPVIEDSTPYLTERSFNAERVTFQADLPMTVAIELRDYMANTTGLEYIGTNRQQMGDGGAMMQFMDATSGEVIGVSNSDWQCMVAQHAPVDMSCADDRDPREGVGVCAEEASMPLGDWTSPDFDATGWDAAVEHTEAEVNPRHGYDDIDWDGAARLIWSGNLLQDNIILCRATIGG